MVVVLPAPFGPRKPTIWPFFDFEGNVVDRDRTGVPLGQALNFDHSLIPDKTNSVVIEGRATTRRMSV
jgi:hypothetical protein